MNALKTISFRPTFVTQKMYTPEHIEYIRPIDKAICPFWRCRHIYPFCLFGCKWEYPYWLNPLGQNTISSHL